MWRADSLEKTLIVGKIEGRRGWQRMRWLDGITNSMDMSLSTLWELVIDREPGVLQSMEFQRVRQDWATELNWMACLRETDGATHQWRTVGKWNEHIPLPEACYSRGLCFLTSPHLWSIKGPGIQVQTRWIFCGASLLFLIPALPLGFMDLSWCEQRVLGVTIWSTSAGALLFVASQPWSRGIETNIRSCQDLCFGDLSFKIPWKQWWLPPAFGRWDQELT